MSIATLIIGNSGTGKTTSLRNLDPAETLLIQCLRKPLPFPSKGWKQLKAGEPTGSIYVTDSAALIINAMQKTKRKIIVVDDWNMVMTAQYMRRSAETGFQKFADIGRDAWDVLMTANDLAEDTRVYLLGHAETSEQGMTKAKTIGKMIDSTCNVESMFTIVMRSIVVNNNYLFATQNSGQDSCKSPMGMFEKEHIDNDLAVIDKEISAYYNPAEPTKE